MYQYVLEGYSINQITEMLNSQRIGGKRFEASNVRYILHNKFYNGKRLFKGQYYDMPVKVIDDYTWNLVQEKLKSNRAYNHEAQIKHFNPLKGIAKCPCGANMMIIFGHNKSGYTMILSCADKARRLKTGCTNSGMRGEVYFDLVWKDVSKYGLADSYKAKSNETIKTLQTELQQYQYALPSKDNAIDDKRKEIETVAINMATVTNAIALSALNKRVDELQDELDSLIKERNKLNRQIAKTEARIKDEEKMLTQNELANITEEGKAEIYKRVLERVTYYSFNGHHKGYIEIVYKNGFISRYLYLNNNQCCYIWALPQGFTVDRESMTITNPLGGKPQKTETGYKFTLHNPKTYTFDEFRKNWDEIKITYK